MILILTTCLFARTSFAQLNIKIGYNLDYSSLNTNNQILSSYNQNNQWLTNGFKDLTFMSGIQLGLRLRNEFIGTDVSWERTTADRTSSGINGGGINVSNDFRYAFHRVGWGLESYNKYFGLGANVYWEYFSIANSQNNSDSRQRFVSDQRLGNKVYLILSAPGTQTISISLQPYLAIPWSPLNLQPLASQLKTDLTSDHQQRNLHFGFSIVFYNGPQ